MVGTGNLKRDPSELLKQEIIMPRSKSKNGQLKPQVQCAICETWMTRITNTHLKKHGLTIQEYSDKHGQAQQKTEPASQGIMSYAPQGLIQKLLEEVLGYLIQDGTLSDGASIAIQNLLKSQDAKIRIALNLIGASKIARLGYYQNKLAEVEAILLSPARLNGGLNSAQLLRTVRYIRESTVEIQDFLKSLTIERKRGMIDFYDRNFFSPLAIPAGLPPPPESPQRRERLRSMIRQILEAADKSDGESSELETEKPNVEVEAPAQIEPGSLAIDEESVSE